MHTAPILIGSFCLWQKEHVPRLYSASYFRPFCGNRLGAHMLIALAGSLVALRWTSLTYAEEWELLLFESKYKELNYFLHRPELRISCHLSRKQMCTFCGDDLPQHVKHWHTPLNRFLAFILEERAAETGPLVLCAGVSSLGLQTSQSLTADDSNRTAETGTRDGPWP